MPLVNVLAKVPAQLGDLWRSVMTGNLYRASTVIIGAIFGGALASSVFAQSVATGQSYDVDCANLPYFKDQISGSPVDVYAHAEGRKPAAYLLNSLNIESTLNTVDEVLLLYNTERRTEVGIIPMVDGCALDKTFVGLKREIDQVLAGMVHKGYLEGADPNRGM